VQSAMLAMGKQDASKVDAGEEEQVVAPLGLESIDV
jgi:hypothetical protein